MAYYIIINNKIITSFILINMCKDGADASLGSTGLYRWLKRFTHQLHQINEPYMFNHVVWALESGGVAIGGAEALVAARPWHTGGHNGS